MRLLPWFGLALAICLTTIAAYPAAGAPCRFPEISLSPTRVVPGDLVTIQGEDFDPNRYVDIYFNDELVEEILLSSRSFTVTISVPQSPAGDHTVRARGEVNGSIVEQDAKLIVRPGLKLSPATGAAGTTVTVQGLGFSSNETDIEVRYGLYEKILDGIEANSNGTWEASFQVLFWSRGQHEIRALGSVHAIIQGVRPAVFRVGPGIAVAGESGAVGQEVAVSGTGFSANERNIRIVIGGKVLTTIPASISADTTGRWEAVFVVPEKPAGDYSVTAEGDQTRQRDIDGVPFEIRPVLKLSPEEGHVGTDLTVEGLGFPVGKRIVILYGDEKVADDIVDSEGSFEAVFEVPESRFGPQEVVAAIKEDPNSVSNLEPVATAVFIMESNHPAAPALESPADGGRIGFFRRATPTFEWEEVFDFSGVYYSIRVATSPDFEPESILVSESGLTVTTYAPKEPLSNGTYYWTVRAVDGAENESQWSDPQRLRVGRLPMWGFIAIFSFIGLLLGLRAYFILVRPRLYE